MSSHSRLQNFFTSRAFINVVILLRCSNAPFEKSGSAFNWKHPKRHLEVEEFEVFAARLNEFQIIFKALAANRGCGSRRACRQLRRFHERTKDWTCFLPGARSRKCFQTTVQGSKFGSALHECGSLILVIIVTSTVLCEFAGCALNDLQNPHVTEMAQRNCADQLERHYFG